MTIVMGTLPVPDKHQEQRGFPFSHGEELMKMEWGALCSIIKWGKWLNWILFTEKNTLETYRWVPYYFQKVQPNVSTLINGTACSSVQLICHCLAGFSLIWLRTLSTIPIATHCWQMSPTLRARNCKIRTYPYLPERIFSISQQFHSSTDCSFHDKKPTRTWGKF